METHKVMNVPSEFQRQIKVAYPPGNLPLLEEWLIKNHPEATEREFIPINWCGYMVNHNYGNDKRAFNVLQNFVKRLPTNKKYWAYTQYDLGITVDISHLDIKCFGSGGGRIDFPLPLICQPHGVNDVVERDIFASFVGSLTHPIRSEMIKSAPPDWYVSTEHHSINNFCNILARSIYSLVPRGFGPTSFRICESLEQGSIPVYISDHWIVPGNVDFNEYGVLVHNDEVRNLDKILKGFTHAQIESKREAGKYYYEKMFTFSGCRQLILDNV
jgi:hypothetical protein